MGCQEVGIGIAAVVTLVLVIVLICATPPKDLLRMHHQIFGRRKD